MSKYKGIRFCDKCLTSIPMGDMYYENGKKDNCSKCKNKWKFPRLVLALLFFVSISMISSKGVVNFDKRIADNENAISKTANYVQSMERKLKNTFGHISRWADSVESRLDRFYVESKQEAKALSSILDSLRKETSGIVAAQAALRKDLTGGKMTDERVAQAISLLSARAKACEEQLQVIMRNPAELIEKVIKPTVSILIRDTKGDHSRGSGVLFKKEEFINKNGKKMYRYYGFTCYHVWSGVWKYLEDIKRPVVPHVIFRGQRVPQKDRTLNPKLLIKYFHGNTAHADRYITNAKFIFPNKYIKEYKSPEDFTIFMFEDSLGDIAVAELATDAEILKNVYYGSRVYATGVAISNVPSLYFGTTANPKLPKDTGIYFQAFGYFGQSGGPIYDAKTLKVVAITQRIKTHPVYGSKAPLSNTVFANTLAEVRKVWTAYAPLKYRKLLN